MVNLGNIIEFIIKAFKYLKKNISLIECVAAVLFILFIPLIARVNFMQNDDWNRTTSVIRFLAGKKVEEKDLNFPGSIFIGPKIFLYKKK